MSFQSKTYQSSLFKSFKAIGAGEFRQIVWYYERNQKAILALEFDEYFEIDHLSVKQMKTNQDDGFIINLCLFSINNLGSFIQIYKELKHKFY